LHVTVIVRKGIIMGKRGRMRRDARKKKANHGKKPTA
jgi:hypothetical protein